MGPARVGLDIGGGPGEHTVAWSALGALAVVVDPAGAMNRLAASAGRVVVCARAEQLPFRTDSVDLAYFHLSIHHTDFVAALGEAVRVTRQGGRIEIITLGPRHHRSSFLQRWFPRVAELDAARFPDPEAIVAELTRLGCDVVATTEIEPKRRPAREWIAAVEARFVSTLQLLDDVEIAAGLDAMRSGTADLDADVAYEMVWERIGAVVLPGASPRSHTSLP